MIDLSRAEVPLAAQSPIDDSSFTEGDIAAWAAAFRTEYRAGRSAGVPLSGRVRISVNVMERMFGEGAPSVLDFPIQQLTQLSSEYDALIVFVDQSLATDTAIVE